MSGVDGLKILLDKTKTGCHISGGVCWDGGTTSQAEKEGRCSKCDTLTEWILKKDVVEFFKDKIVVDRKQLEDLMKQQPFPEAFKWITDFKSQYQHWTKKLKKLLEGKVVSESGSVEAQK